MADQANADALRASEARLRTILATAVDAFVTIDHSGTIESFNPAAERMFGYAAAEVIGRNVRMLMPPPFEGEHDSYLARYLATGERRIIGIGREAVARKQDGTLFPVDLAVGEGWVGGRRIFTGVLRDLTERKRLETNLQRAQRMHTLGSLAGGIAHDLNNVLAIVLTAADNLELDLPPDERAAVLNELRGSARRGSAIVRQLLTFARGAGAAEGPMQPTPLLHDLVRLLRHLLPRSVRLAATIAEGLRPIPGDSTQLYQVLINLAVNARDAMPDGGTLTVTAEDVLLAPADVRDHPGARPGTYLRLAVRDTGVGIPPERLGQIFEPFFTTKPPGEGTGLGLATVRDILRRHGGFVVVRSDVGRGSEFEVVWPALAEASAAAAARPEIPRGRGELILVAVAERSFGQLACATLGAYGYRALLADSADDAVLQLKRPDADVGVVVLDVASGAVREAATSSGVPVVNRPETAEALLQVVHDVLCGRHAEARP